MPRGSKPGERRGGRQKGTPNKRTALERAVLVATLDHARISPLELTLALMRNPSLSLERRVNAAQKALPFVHAKLRRGAAKRSAKKSTTDNGDDAESKTDRTRRPRVKTRRIVLPDAPKDADITPLRFLQRLLWDHKTPAELRIKIAAMITPYVHHKPSGQAGEAEQIANSGHARAVVIDDPFGFDPELIYEMQTDEYHLGQLQRIRAGTGVATAEEIALLKRIKQRRSSLYRPDDYTVEEMQKDLDRRQALISKLRSKQANSKLTPEERAEFLHLGGRIYLYPNRPRINPPTLGVRDVNKRVPPGREYPAAMTKVDEQNPEPDDPQPQLDERMSS